MPAELRYQSFSWRRFLAHCGLAALIGPPIGGFLFWLGTVIVFVIIGDSSPNPPFSGMINLLFIMLIWAYPVGVIPALVAGVFFVLMQAPHQSLSPWGSVGLGALSGLLATLVSLFVVYIFSYSDFSEVLTMGAVLTAIGVLSGAIGGYLLKRLLA